MEDKKKKGVFISGTIIASTLTAILAYSANEIQRIPVIDTKVKAIEKVQDKIEKKLDKIYDLLLTK